MVIIPDTPGPTGFDFSAPGPPDTGSGVAPDNGTSAGRPWAILGAILLLGSILSVRLGRW